MDIEIPGRHFRYDVVRANEFVLDYAEAGPDGTSPTIVSIPAPPGWKCRWQKTSWPENITSWKSTRPAGAAAQT